MPHPLAAIVNKVADAKVFRLSGKVFTKVKTIFDIVPK
jgi:hypothetical protein